MEETNEGGGDLVDLMNLDIEDLRKLVSKLEPNEKFQDIGKKSKEEDDEEFQVQIIEEDLSDNDQDDTTESQPRDRNSLLHQHDPPASSSLMARTKSFLHINSDRKPEESRRKTTIVGVAPTLQESGSSETRTRSASDFRRPVKSESKEVVNTITRKRRFWLSMLELGEVEERKLEHLTDDQWKYLEKAVGNGQGISRESLILLINDLQTNNDYKISPPLSRDNSKSSGGSPEVTFSSFHTEKILKTQMSHSSAASPGLKRKTSIKNLIMKREKDRSFSVNEKSAPQGIFNSDKEKDILRSRSVSVSLFSKKKLVGNGDESPVGSPNSNTPSPNARRNKGEYFTVNDYELQRIPQQDVESFIQEDCDIDEYPVGQLTTQKDYWLELGKVYENSALNIPKLEDMDKYEYYYRDQFFAKKHTNYIGMTDNKDYVIMSISEPEIKDEKLCYRSFIRNYQCDKREDLVFENSTKNVSAIQKKLKSALAHMSNVKKLYKIETADFAQDLLKYELKMVVTHQKIGVLLRKEGQTTEEEMFNNSEPTQNLVEFLDCIGQTLTLEGMKGFTGGLDVKKNSTGTHSVKTKFKGLEIMYHVSTMLPHFEKDLQQVEKKRHIGNDIVVIVFNDAKTAFRPQVMKSEYNHVYLVVQPEKNEQGETQYKIASCSKHGTPPFGPLLPYPPVFTKGEEFTDFLMTKLVNAERASLYAPSFAPKIRRTRKVLLEELAIKHLKKK